MATLESRACPGRYSNEQARGHGIRDWRTMNDWIFCHLQQCARKAEQGWFLIDLDNGYLGWVHRDVACEHPTCPMAGVRHRHLAKPHERGNAHRLFTSPRGSKSAGGEVKRRLGGGRMSRNCGASGASARNRFTATSSCSAGTNNKGPVHGAPD